MEELQHLKYKRIYCENQHNDEACHGHNSMVYQSIDDLEKLILDKQALMQGKNLRDDKITFFENEGHQMLLI